MSKDKYIYNIIFVYNYKNIVLTPKILAIISLNAIDRQVEKKCNISANSKQNCQKYYKMLQTNCQKTKI